MQTSRGCPAPASSASQCTPPSHAQGETQMKRGLCGCKGLDTLKRSRVSLHQSTCLSNVCAAWGLLTTVLAVASGTAAGHWSSYSASTRASWQTWRRTAPPTATRRPTSPVQRPQPTAAQVATSWVVVVMSARYSHNRAPQHYAVAAGTQVVKTTMLFMLSRKCTPLSATGARA